MEFDIKEFKRGYQTFQTHEKRDVMYTTAAFLVNTYWEQPKKVTDGVGVLLLTWNQAFYRYGSFDFEELERCIIRNQALLDGYHLRNILAYTPDEDEKIKKLYSEFLIASAIGEGKAKGKQSDVSVGKTLHLLAPGFFPLWDKRIATAYECYYKYIPFMSKMQTLAHELESYPEILEDNPGKTPLKLIDEFNYAKYTKMWI